LSCGGSHTMVLDARGAALNEVSHDVSAASQREIEGGKGGGGAGRGGG
jgi:hypothetical protein